METSNWKDFYMSRVNSDRYLNHFQNKYKPFLNMVKRHMDKDIFEAGCGLGMVSLCLRGAGVRYSGVDICSDMVDMANLNVGVRAFFQGDMFQNTTETFTVTHGVLEHFNDNLIVEACKLYPNSVHYVPLDKYVTPSFGDERLLPYKHWIELLNPAEFIVFNDGHDLAFKL